MKLIFTLLTSLLGLSALHAQFADPQELFSGFSAEGFPIHFDANPATDYVMADGKIYLNAETPNSRIGNLNFDGDTICYVADFTGDGLDDFLFSKRIAGEIHLMLGHNVGGTSVTISDTGILLIESAVSYVPAIETLNSRFRNFADIDTDGDIDILCRHGLYLNDGNGVFFLAVSLAPTNDVDLSDMDGDGALDILHGDFYTDNLSGVQWRKNNGNGNFGAPQNFTGINASVDYALRAFADVNNDGREDLVTTTFGYFTLQYSYNLGNGAFAAPVDATVSDFATYQDINRVDMYCRDMDGDGDEDIILMIQGTGNYPILNLRLMMIDNNGTLFPVTMASYDFPFDAVDTFQLFSLVFDKNNDIVCTYGNIYTARYRHAMLYVEVQNDYSTTTHRACFNSLKKETYPGDFNNDGITDYVISFLDMLQSPGGPIGQERVLVMQGTGNGEFNVPVEVWTSNSDVDYDSGSGCSMVVADFNNDGIDDLFHIHRSDAMKTFYGSNTGLTLQSSQTLPSGMYFASYFLSFNNESSNNGDVFTLKAEDVDQDGLVDVILPFTGILKNTGSGFTNYASTITIDGQAANSTNFNPVMVADFDNDGLLDILHNYSTYTDTLNAILFQNAPNVYETVVIDLGINPYLTSHYDNTVNDLNGDGFLDIIANRNYLSSTGSRSYGPRQIIPYSVKGAFDYDNDGDLDLLMYDSPFGYYTNIAVAENTGAGVFASSVLYNGVLPWFVSSYDFDDDGDKDVFGYSQTTFADQRYYLWENLSSTVVAYSINGVVYHDANNNGVQDSGENAIPNVPVKLMPSNYTVYTNDLGEYSFLPSAENTYTVSTHFASNNFADASQTVIISAATPSAVVDFATASVAVGTHADAYIQANHSGCNIDRAVQVVVTNTGAEAITVTPSLGLSSNLTFVSSASATFNAGNIVWNAVVIQPNDFYAFDAVVHYPAYTIPWPVFAFNANITAVGSQTITLQPQVSFNQACSYDPNAITELTGYTDRGFVDGVAPLVYDVQFQNTGGAPAENVRVECSLPASLDPSSVEIASSSHPITLTTIDENNVLRVYFDNIQLTDSTTDELASHGNFVFRVNVVEGYPAFTSILNSASIYFDTNEPVITNTVSNEIFDCNNYVTVHSEYNGSCDAPATLVSFTSEWVSAWQWTNSTTLLFTADSTWSIAAAADAQEIVFTADNELCPAYQTSVNVAAEITLTISTSMVDSELYFNGPTDMTNYSWVQSGLVVPGLNTPTISLSQIGFTEGYWVYAIAYDIYGCVHQSNTLFEIGVAENASTTFSLSPNPAASAVTIRRSATTAPIVITTSTGLPMLNLTQPNSTLTLDISTWPAGVYIVRSGAHCEKLVVE